MYVHYFMSLAVFVCEDESHLTVHLMLFVVSEERLGQRAFQVSSISSLQLLLSVLLVGTECLHYDDRACVQEIMQGERILPALHPVRAPARL